MGVSTREEICIIELQQHPSTCHYYLLLLTTMLKWHRDRQFLSQYPDLKLLRQDGRTVPASEAFRGKKYVLIFFGAHWCSPCQRFTPVLADFYNQNADRYGFEVLFISSDREERRMMDYFQNRSSNYVMRPTNTASSGGLGLSPASTHGDASTNAAWTAMPSTSALPPSTLKKRFECSSSSIAMVMMDEEKESAASGGALLPPSRPQKAPPSATGHGNWLALPFKERKIARQIGSRYSAKSVPKVVVVEVSTSAVVTRDGKARVFSDPSCSQFPWKDDSRSRRRWPLLALVLMVATVMLILASGTWPFTRFSELTRSRNLHAQQPRVVEKSKPLERSKPVERQHREEVLRFDDG